MAYADVNGQQLYFEDSGGDGPAVLFSHGFLMDGEMFEPQVARPVADVPVHHLGRAGVRAHRVRRQAVHVLGLGERRRRRCSITSASTARCSPGMSQGGFLSLRAALAHPARVRASC